MQHELQMQTVNHESDAGASEDAFVSHEELLQREEDARYGGAQGSDRFTVMYYPQSRLLSVPTVQEQAKVVLDPNQRICSACSNALQHLVHRAFANEPMYCTDCLRQMGCCVLATSGEEPKGLCADVVGIVLSFIPEYYQATLAARVCKMWMGCFNFNNNHESDMMAIKRYWISRELHFQRAAARRDQRNVLLFEQRFELAPLLGQWVDGQFKTARQWLSLCRRIVESGYYAQEFGIVVASAHARMRLERGEQAVLECSIDARSETPNTFRIPLCLSEKGGTLSAVLHADDSGPGALQNTFTADVACTKGGRLSFLLDPRTGLVSPNEANKPKRRKLRCICL